MKFKALLPLLAMTFSAHALTFGVVNFNSCMADSKFGQKEQGEFEKMREQMTTLVTDIEKQLESLQKKLTDPDHLDSISPEAEQEMKNQFQALSEELNRYQQQYYQVMNQANMKIMQAMSERVGRAAEKIAEKKKLEFVMNKEACFYYDPKTDVTTQVIAEMDKNFEAENKTTEQEKK